MAEFNDKSCCPILIKKIHLENWNFTFCKGFGVSKWVAMKTIRSLKLRHYEKATKYEKNLPPVLTKQLFLISSVKTSERFFQIFVA